MFTGGNGQFYPYSGFDGVQQATVSTAGNNFGNCYDKFTSGGVTWYDEFVGFTNKTIPGNHERDEFVSVSTTAGTIGSCWFNITDDQIDYPIRMPWGAPIF